MPRDCASAPGNGSCWLRWPAAPAGLSASALRERGFDVAGLRRLGLRDLVSIRRQAVERDPFAGVWGRTAKAAARALDVTLTDEQDAAFERLRGRLDEGRFAWPSSMA